jgi:hypothetical protein
MFEISYSARLLLLLALMGSVAVYDYCRHKHEATKWKEYSYILACGLIACVYGMANDSITFKISPDYFIYGKSLRGSNLETKVLILGAQAGFVAGLIGGMVFLIFNGKVKAGYWYLFGLLRYPIILACAGGVVFAFLLNGQDPLGYVEIMNEALSPVEVDRFMRVWWAHCGTYLGFVVGVIVAVKKLREVLL